ncbi:MAG: hypothetical protein ACPL06_04250 [Candidatus Anstonellales archaeon]
MARKKKMINGYPVRRSVVYGKEGEIGEQVGAFGYMFEKLAYGDRSRYGRKELNEFESYVDMLSGLLDSVKENAEKKFINWKR